MTWPKFTALCFAFAAGAWSMHSVVAFGRGDSAGLWVGAVGVGVNLWLAAMGAGMARDSR